MTRTRTAPAKKTTARETTAKKTAASKTTAAKPTPKTATGPTLVDLRKPLPVRRRRIVGPHTQAQIVEARAALASATAQLPVPHLLWLAQIDGRAAARLADGTHLIHAHERLPEFHAYIRCPGGGLHQHTITNDRELRAARTITGTCTRRHDDTDGDSPYDWQKAAALGVQRLVPARLSPLNVGLQTARKAIAATQPISRNDIAEGLAGRATVDTEQPKEHPQP